jgi:predicted NAD-dependent protein-ADP-ribosyltransferase YbiA (DUF1768 family)
MGMHFSRLLLIVAAALPLGACMTAAEQQAQARAIAASDDAACRSAGAKAGTPAYAKCLENRSNQRAVLQREEEHAMQRQMWMMNQSATQSFMRPRL